MNNQDYYWTQTGKRLVCLTVKNYHTVVNFFAQVKYSLDYSQAGQNMTAEGMTSISVSYEVRRQLNTLRTFSGYKSVNELLNDLIRAHKITKMNGEVEKLRERMKAVADVDVEHLVDRLNLSPFRV